MQIGCMRIWLILPHILFKSKNNKKKITRLKNIDEKVIFTRIEDYEFQQWAPAQHIGFELTSEGIFQFIELKRIDL